MRNKEEYKERLRVLIETGGRFRQTEPFLDRTQIADCQYWFSQIITLVQSITGIDKFFYDEARQIIYTSKRQRGIFWNEIQMMLGFLKQLHDAIDNELLTRVQEEASAADFTSFLVHAKYYCDNEKKMESAVIASAIFEDSIKKVALKNGISTTSNIETAINALKSKGVLSSLEAKKFKYYAGIRNSALHASWDEFNLADVNDLISGTSKLIEEYLAH